MNREKAVKILKRELALNKIECNPNQLIAFQGDCNGMIYHVENGWTKLSKISDDGKEISIDICGPGEFIGLPTLFSDKEFPVNITALTTGRVLSVSKISLERMLLQHPDIMAVLLVELGEKIVKLRGIKIAANQQDAIGQVRDLLTHFAKIFGADISNGRLIPFILTQQDIADFVGLSRPRVNICLKVLLELGYIHRQGRYYVLPTAVQETTSDAKQNYAQGLMKI